MNYSTYSLSKGDTVPCMKCGNTLVLMCDPPKCCIDEQDAYYNQCGCRGMPEPIFCDDCWKELEE